MQNILNAHQQHQKGKEYRRNGLMMKKEVFKKGICACCDMEKTIIKVRHSLCKMCSYWIRQIILKKYGYYHERHIPEALIEFKKPVQCRFYQYCGQEIPRFDKNGFIMNNRRCVCEKCFPIYKAGFLDGKKFIKKRLIGGRMGKDDEFKYRINK